MRDDLEVLVKLWALLIASAFLLVAIWWTL